MTKDQEKMIFKLKVLAMIEEVRKHPGSVFQIPVPRKMMEEMNTEPLTNALEMMLENAGIVRDLRDRVLIDFEGFEGEKSELDELPFVQKYLEAVSEKFPFWFWFMPKASFDINLKRIFYCLNPADQRNEFGLFGFGVVARLFKPDDVANFMAKYAEATRQLGERFNLNKKEITETLQKTERYYRQAIGSKNMSKVAAGTFI